MDQLVEPDAREALVEKIRDEAQHAAREARGRGRRADRPTTPCARPRAPTPRSPSRRSGACARSTSTSTTSIPTSTGTCCSSSTGAAAARRARSGSKLLEGDGEDEGFVPKLERMWREQDYIEPRAKLGYFPCNADGNELVIFDPEAPDTEIERLVFPRQPKHDRICLTDFYRPLDSGRARRRRAPGGDGRAEVDRASGAAREGRRVLGAAVRPRPRRADGRGHGRVAALGGAPRARDRARTRAAATRGATRPARSSRSTRRSGSCSISRRSA